jgi:hypothetical protein
MGKGGCFDVFESGVRFIRSILGCICCLLCTGPILVIVGIVLLVAPNNFKENINTYKSSIDTYKAQAQPILQKTSGTINTWYTSTGHSLGVTTMQIQFKGVNADQATPFASTVLVASNVQMLAVSSASSSSSTNSINNLRYTDAPLGVVPMSTTSIRAPQDTGSVPFQSSIRPSSSCSSTPSTSKSGCMQSDFDQACANHFGSGVRYSNWYSACAWYQQEKYICSPITFSTSTNQWSVDTSFTSGGSNFPSCDYIDGNNQLMGSYSMSPVVNGFGYDPLNVVDYNTGNSPSPSPNLNVYLRSSLDPYIVASKLTQGSFDFGLSAAQQRSIGATLIAAGCILIACVIGSCIMVQCMVSRDPRNRAAVYGAFGRTYTPQQGYAALPPGTYGGVYYGPQGPQPMPYCQPAPYGQPVAPYQAMPMQQPQQPYQGQPYQQQPQQQCSPVYPPSQRPGYGQPQQYQQPPQQYQQQPQPYQQQPQPHQQSHHFL